MARKIYQWSIEGLIVVLIGLAYVQCFYQAAIWTI